MAEKGISCDELTAHESPSIRTLCSDARLPRVTQRIETLLVSGSFHLKLPAADEVHGRSLGDLFGVRQLATRPVQYS